MPKSKQAVLNQTKQALSRISRFLDNFQRKQVVDYDIDKRSILLKRDIRFHTIELIKVIQKGMSERSLHNKLFAYAQEWRMWHGLSLSNVKSGISTDGGDSTFWLRKARDDGAIKLIGTLLLENITGRPDNWFDLPDYEKKYSSFAKTSYGKSAGRAFSRNGIFINLNMEKPEIALAIAARSNYIKDLPDTQFRRMQEILFDKYYLEGLHPSELAKEFSSAGLWDEYYDGRSWAIARTETMSIVSAARRSEYLEKTMNGHYWLTAHDNIVRDAHVDNELAGVLPIEESFPSGQKFPGDGGDPSLVVNCRCSEEATTLEGSDNKEDIDREEDRDSILEGYNEQGYEAKILPDMSRAISQYFYYRGLTSALVDEAKKVVYYNYYPSFLE